MQWYYSKNGTQFGPVGEGELRSKINSGEISSVDLVWREGMSDWLPVTKVSEFSAAPALASPSQPTVYPTANSPYQPPTQQAPANYPNIPNYLWQSIVVTLFCCLPFGIAAIVFAARVDGLKMSGNIQGALEASAAAKKWCIVSLCCWLGLVALYILAVIVTVGVNR